MSLFFTCLLHFIQAKPFKDKKWLMKKQVKKRDEDEVIERKKYRFA